MSDSPTDGKHAFLAWFVPLGIIVLLLIVGIVVAMMSDKPSDNSVVDKVAQVEPARTDLAQTKHPLPTALVAPMVRAHSNQKESATSKKIEPLTTPEKASATSKKTEPLNPPEKKSGKVTPKPATVQKVIDTPKQVTPKQVIRVEHLSPPKSVISEKNQPLQGDEKSGNILYEEHFSDKVSDKKASKPHLRMSPPPARKKKVALPSLALIIDDLGYNGTISRAMVSLPVDLTLAILPGGQFSREIATMGYQAGREILLHQPMEPKGFPSVNPGPGAMYASMGPARIQRVLNDNLGRLPEAVGINNHMGSSLTENSMAMDAVMQVLLNRGMFFIDSRTSDATVAMQRAEFYHVPTSSREIFIDNVQDVDAIFVQLIKLQRLALRHGTAIGIGHPYKSTLIAIQQWLPQLEKLGIQMVRVSRFLHPKSAQKNYPDKGSHRVKSDTDDITGIPSLASSSSITLPTTAP